MTPEETAKLVKRLRRLPLYYTQVPQEFTLAATTAADALESLQSSLDSRDTTIDKLESEQACLLQELEHSQKRVADMLIQLGDLQQRHLTMIRELAKEKA